MQRLRTSFRFDSFERAAAMQLDTKVTDTFLEFFQLALKSLQDEDIETLVYAVNTRWSFQYTKDKVQDFDIYIAREYVKRVQMAEEIEFQVSKTLETYKHSLQYEEWFTEIKKKEP